MQRDEFKPAAQIIEDLLEDGPAGKTTLVLKEGQHFGEMGALAMLMQPQPCPPTPLHCLLAPLCFPSSSLHGLPALVDHTR